MEGFKAVAIVEFAQAAMVFIVKTVTHHKNLTKGDGRF